MRAGGRLAGRRRGGAAVLGDPALRFRGRAVVDGDVVASPRQVPGHRVTHDAQPEEGDFLRRDWFV